MEREEQVFRKLFFKRVTRVFRVFRFVTTGAFGMNIASRIRRTASRFVDDGASPVLIYCVKRQDSGFNAAWAAWKKQYLTPFRFPDGSFDLWRAGSTFVISFVEAFGGRAGREGERWRSWIRGLGISAKLVMNCFACLTFALKDGYGFLIPTKRAVGAEFSFVNLRISKVSLFKRI